MSPLLCAASPALILSTFSCDIAGPVSPRTSVSCAGRRIGSELAGLGRRRRHGNARRVPIRIGCRRRVPRRLDDRSLPRSHLTTPLDGSTLGRRSPAPPQRPRASPCWRPPYRVQTRNFRLADRATGIRRALLRRPAAPVATEDQRRRSDQRRQAAHVSPPDPAQHARQSPSRARSRPGRATKSLLTCPAP
jgi:hypothetical protein